LVGGRRFTTIYRPPTCYAAFEVDDSQRRSASITLVASIVTWRQAGSMTSSRHFKYGLLGTSVNCASRVETLTKPGRLDAPLRNFRANRKIISRRDCVRALSFVPD